jgi:hypothetical protein
MCEIANLATTASPCSSRPAKNLENPFGSLAFAISQTPCTGQLILFDMQNRTLHPYLAANDTILTVDSCLTRCVRTVTMLASRR